MSDAAWDIGRDFPPEQKGKCLEEKRYSCFGYSLQGTSHKERKIPCQDFNDFRYVKGADVLVAAVADGVGSCPFSHWGAYVAVETAVDYTEKELQALSNRKKLRLAGTGKIQMILYNAFVKAADAVEDLAENQKRPVSALMSTLTLAVYDGSCLYCQHIGDDGVVAQFQDGSVKLITQRNKGEEASSVYPLQSGRESWQFCMAGLDERGPVTAFVIATDGVLDAFVMGNDAYANVEGCCGGIFYPFMERAVYMAGSKNKLLPRKAETALSYYLEQMNSERYRRQVTDDLTLISVICPTAVSRGGKPYFNREVFNATALEIRKRQREMLYSNRISAEEHEKPAGPDTGAGGLREPYSQPRYHPEEESEWTEEILKNKKMLIRLGLALVAGMCMGAAIILFTGKIRASKESAQPKSFVMKEYPAAGQEDTQRLQEETRERTIDQGHSLHDQDKTGRDEKENRILMRSATAPDAEEREQEKWPEQENKTKD